jgi:peptide-methionine (S)-S-oxide reductase
MIKSVIIAAALSIGFATSSANAQNLQTATFAGGCFWCVESDFDQIPGVVKTVSGYTGGSLDNPNYKQVSAGGTGHLEAVEITFDPSQVTYDELLTAFWHSVDPTDAGGQFCDRGESYTTAVFVHGDEQRRLAEASKQTAMRELGQEIVTPIREASAFYTAEEYHQDFYQKSSVRYRYYRWACGRNDRVEEVWGDSAYKGIPAHG